MQVKDRKAGALTSAVPLVTECFASPALKTIHYLFLVPKLSAVMPRQAACRVPRRLNIRGGLRPSESAHSERTEPVRLWKPDVAPARIQDPPSSSLQRRGRALAALGPFVGEPVRDRLTLPQSLEVLLGLDSPPSASKAGLLHARQQVSASKSLQDQPVSDVQQFTWAQAVNQVELQ